MGKFKSFLHSKILILLAIICSLSQVYGQLDVLQPTHWFQNTNSKWENSTGYPGFVSFGDNTPAGLGVRYNKTQDWSAYGSLTVWIRTNATTYLNAKIGIQIFTTNGPVYCSAYLLINKTYDDLQKINCGFNNIDSDGFWFSAPPPPPSGAQPAQVSPVSGWNNSNIQSVSNWRLIFDTTTEFVRVTLENAFLELSPNNTAMVDKFGQYNRIEFPNKVHSTAEMIQKNTDYDTNLNSKPDVWDDFGGWLNGPQMNGTSQSQYTYTYEIENE